MERVTETGYFRGKGAWKALLFYGVLIAVLYAPVVFTAKTLLPGNIYPHGIVESWPYEYEGRTHKDTLDIDLATPAYYEAPINRLVGKQILSGIVPLWNPYQAGGTPLAAQYSTRVFFPYQILENISPVWTWDFYLLGRLLIAGLFTFLFLRGIGLAFSTSFIGGAFYIFSGSFTWFINLEQMANVAMVAPMLLLSMDILAKRGQLKDVAISSVVFALVLVAGQPESALYVLFLGALYFFFRLFSLPACPGRGGILRSTGRLALAFIIGFMLSAPLIFPFIELWANAYHIHPLGGDMGVRNPNRIYRLVDILTPTFNEMIASPRTSIFPLAEVKDSLGSPHFTKIFPSNGKWDFLGGYSGALMVFLALSGLFLSLKKGWRRFKANQIFFSSFTLLVLLKNFGLEPFKWLGYLPFFDQVWSQRWAGPSWALALAIAAAIACQMLSDALKGKPLAEWGEARGGRWVRLTEFYEKRGDLLRGIAIHAAALWSALWSARYLVDLYLNHSAGAGLSYMEKFAIKSYRFPSLVVVVVAYLLLRRSHGAGVVALSKRGYAYLLFAAFIIINIIVLLGWFSTLDTASTIRLGGVNVLSVMVLTYLLLAIYIYSWSFAASYAARSERPYAIFFLSLGAIFFVYLLALANVWYEPMKIEGVIDYYYASSMTGVAVTVAMLFIALGVGVYYLKKGRGLYALMGLGLLELWYAIPRGYDDTFIYYKHIPLLIGLVAVFFLMIERWRLAAVAALVFLCAFIWLDTASPYGFPERYDPFTESPYVEFLKEKAGYDRVIGTYGTLFPNYASSVGLYDIMFVNSLAIRNFQYFRLVHLHILDIERLNSSSLWFTGRGELHHGGRSRWVRDSRTKPEMEMKKKLKFYSMMGVKYLVAPSDKEIAHSDFPLIYDKEVKIYENPDALSRAFVLHDLQVARSYESIAYLLEEDAFDPARVAILERAPPGGVEKFAASGRKKADGIDNEKAIISDYASDRVVVEAELFSPGIVVLSDVFYPGWKAYVDDVETEIVRVDGVIRGVFVEGGAHRVVFDYRPLSFRLGVIVFMLAIVLAGLFFVMPVRDKGEADA